MERPKTSSYGTARGGSGNERRSTPPSGVVDQIEFSAVHALGDGREVSSWFLEIKLYAHDVRDRRSELEFQQLFQVTTDSFRISRVTISERLQINITLLRGLYPPQHHQNHCFFHFHKLSKQPSASPPPPEQQTTQTLYNNHHALENRPQRCPLRRALRYSSASRRRSPFPLQFHQGWS